MQFVLLGISLMLIVVVISRLLLSADAATLSRILKVVLVIGAIVGVVFLAAVGRIGLAIGLAGMLLPMLFRWRAMARRLKAASGPTPGQASSVRTAFLEARLDHDTGAMDALILQGPFGNRMLSDLQLEDLCDLLRDLQVSDSQSAALVETYLDRAYGPDWRLGSSRDGEADSGDDPNKGDSQGSGRGQGPGQNSQMSVSEARLTLGVSETATRQEIKEAHRRLMKQFHPDHGGTDYLAAKLNEAKEILLEYARD